MTGEKHARLSASASHRWLACPPSVALCERYEDKGSSYAAEGSAAHSLCEHKLKKALGLPTKDPTADLSYYNEEMEQCADDYAAYILEIMAREREAGHDPHLFIEQRVEYSRYVKDGFGTCDAVVATDGTLYVVDFKFGKGIKVEAEGNSQLRIYALGALEAFSCLYDISVVSMVIFQPRLDHISDWTVNAESVTQWAEEVLIPTAALAENGEGEYQAGDHCQFCKAKAECRTRAEQSMSLARLDFKRPPLLEDDEVESILGKIDDLVAWAGDIKNYALQAALGGKRWNGWKLVEGRSNRKYTDETAVAETVTVAGYDPYERSVKGVTAMEKLLGKKKFAELLGGLVEKPQGKPVLVPEGDKREAINVNTAADDFADHEN